MKDYLWELWDEALRRSGMLWLWKTCWPAAVMVIMALVFGTELLMMKITLFIFQYPPPDVIR